MRKITRPTPRGEGRHSQYDMELVAAYRKANAVSQIELSEKMRVSQPYISMSESAKRGITSEFVEAMLKAVDSIAATRARLAAEGAAEMAAIRSGTFVRPVTVRGRWRTAAESRAILDAQARGER
jgi:transcriptional regulator with XRE-family HTH domain